MAMPERICAYRAHAQHREIHNQRLIKSPPRPDYQQVDISRAIPAVAFITEMMVRPSSGDVRVKRWVPAFMGHAYGRHKRGI